MFFDLLYKNEQLLLSLFFMLNHELTDKPQLKSLSDTYLWFHFLISQYIMSMKSISNNSNLSLITSCQNAFKSYFLHMKGGLSSVVLLEHLKCSDLEWVLSAHVLFTGFMIFRRININPILYQTMRIQILTVIYTS